MCFIYFAELYWCQITAAQTRACNISFRLHTTQDWHLSLRDCGVENFRNTERFNPSMDWAEALYISRMYVYHVLLDICPFPTLEVCPSRVLKVCLSHTPDIWPITCPRCMSITYVSVHTVILKTEAPSLNQIVAPNVKMAHNKRISQCNENQSSEDGTSASHWNTMYAMSGIFKIMAISNHITSAA